MKAAYSDITERIDEEPRWWDENGVPRYRDHHPQECQDIYAEEVVLMRIRCQYCGEKFLVQMSRNSTQLAQMKDEHSDGIISFEEEGYGDPPRHGCVGDTMTSETEEIVESWSMGARSVGKWVVTR